MPIEPGQVYRSVAPIPSEPQDRYRFIKVIGKPATIPGVWGFGTVRVATLTEDGREIRPRSLKLTELHESPLTSNGHPRKFGYVLEQP